MRTLFFLLFVGSISISATTSEHSKQKEITKTVIRYFEENQISEIYALFDDTMKLSLSEEKLSEIWKSLPLQCGKYLRAGEARSSVVQGGMVIVHNFLDFELVDLDLRLAFNEANQISGMYFVPAEKKKD